MLGDDAPQGEEWVARRFAELAEEIGELSRSVPESFAPVVKKLQQTIIETIEATYSTSAETTVEIQATVSAPPGAVAAAGPVSGATLSTPGSATVGTTLAVTGSGTIGGTVSVGGRLTANTGVTSTGVRGNQVVFDYVAMYCDRDGNFGYAPSTMATKTLLSNFTVDLEQWLTLIPKVFAYKDDPTRTEQLGLYAELVVRREPMLGIYDEQHRLRGIRYELLGVVCLGLIQAHVAETRATRDRVDRIAAHLGLDI